MNLEFENMIKLMKQACREHYNSLSEKKAAIKQIFEENLHCIQSEAEVRKLLGEVDFYYKNMHIDYARDNGLIIDKNTPDEILSWCVNHSRNEVSRSWFSGKFLGDCKQAAQFVDQGLELFDKRKVKNFKIDTSKVFGGNFQHTMNIAEIGDKKYIVDPTFAQFLIYIYTLESFRELVPNKCIPVGAWFTSKPENEKFIDELVKNGYIEANDENLKRYFDCFVLANDKKRKNLEDSKVDYTAKDYLQMLGIEKTKNFE